MGKECFREVMGQMNRHMHKDDTGTQEGLRVRMKRIKLFGEDMWVILPEFGFVKGFLYMTKA